jgi:uncharacterized protein (TIGR03663 family)
MMHGPFLFHANALIYYLFGTSDYTCRVMPAITAVGTIVMAYFFRAYLGSLAALLIAALIAYSPSFTYFGRFIRNDIYIAFFSMIMVIGLFRFLDTRKSKFLYLAMAFFSLSFCTKEVTYITAWIFASFFVFRWLWEKTTSQEEKPGWLLSGMRTLWAKPEASPAANLLVQSVRKLGLDRPWVMAIAVFLGIAIFLYTTMFTHWMGIVDAFTKSFSYWLGQHEVQRGSQPVYFYAGLIPLYETLIALATFAACAYYGFIKDARYRVWRLLAYAIIASAWLLFSSHGTETFGLVFSLVLVTLGTGLLAYFSFGSTPIMVVFLIFWSLAAFSNYSFAGERMPWLILHPLLPMTLLTGKLLADFWERWPKARWAWIAVVGFGMSMMLHNTALVNFYGKGANPRELLVYVQSSPDVQQITRQLKNMSQRLYGDYSMKITCEDYCSWPFAWYLRDFTQVGYPKFTANQAEGSIEKNPVILSGIEMAAPGHDDRVRVLLENDYVSQRYKLRVWWSPDKQLFLGDTLAGMAMKFWRLFMYREPWNGLGSYDMVVYVRKDLAHLYWSHTEEKL